MPPASREEPPRWTPVDATSEIVTPATGLPVVAFLTLTLIVPVCAEAGAG